MFVLLIFLNFKCSFYLILYLPKEVVCNFNTVKIYPFSLGFNIFHTFSRASSKESKRTLVVPKRSLGGFDIMDAPI